MAHPRLGGFIRLAGGGRSGASPQTAGSSGDRAETSRFYPYHLRWAADWSEDMAGKVVLVNFWASWCKPCEQEAADLQSAWEYYQPRGDVLFLGIAWTDTEMPRLDYLDRFDITYPNGPDLGTTFPRPTAPPVCPKPISSIKMATWLHVKLSPFTSLAEIKAAIDPLSGSINPPTRNVLMDIGSLFLYPGHNLIPVLIFISRPLIEHKLSTSSQAEHELSALLARRDQVVATLQELDDDYNLGKNPTGYLPLPTGGLAPKWG